MNSQHTPGPWHVEFTYNPRKEEHEWRIGPARQDADGDQKVTHVAATVSYCCGPQQKRNAHLIKAAPEMLEALHIIMLRYADKIKPVDRERIREILNRAQP